MYIYTYTWDAATHSKGIYKPLLTESQKKKKKNERVNPNAGAWSAQRFPAEKALKRGTLTNGKQPFSIYVYIYYLDFYFFNFF